MKKRFEQGVLRHLAAVAIAFGAGVAPVEGLREIPVPVLGELVEAIGELDWTSENRRRLLSLLAHDGRAEVRSRVAEKASAVWHESPYQTEELLRRLVCDASPAVRSAAAVGVEQVLQDAPPFERIKLVAEWATSAVSQERAALAIALRGSMPLFVGDLAIELLATDPEPLVRRLALDAAAHRFHEDPTAYTRVAMRAAADPAVEVRQSAHRVLERARPA